MTPGELRDICAAAAQAGAEVLRDLYHQPRDVHFKGRIDLVTDADKASEETILRVLRQRAPGARILAEESGAHEGEDLCFIVDPLDGTTNYAHGLPAYAVSIALEAAGRVELGVIYDPSHEELYVAERGHGASCNGERIGVSAATSLDESLLTTGFPYDIRVNPDNNLKEYAVFATRSRAVRRFGSAVIDLAWVACGRYDGFWELRLGPWDVAAGGLLVEEAGGRVTNLEGGPLDVDKPALVASNGRIHDAILAILREVRG
jgi:myo-inositol-1(or 4)-monophosphatase